ncbi:DEAD/DEAH box helicase [Rathayibacter sp. YIM 133350]|uniref:DEAD/DEAH box helicase n=1 Tax=Rathayibacter sp. YIM 133350 TaxID=3131992 RepID=UPI00307CCCF2
MTSPSFPFVAEIEVMDFVGRTSFARGRSYFTGSAVSDLTWDDGAERLRARVQGAEPLPYVCSVDVETDVRGRTGIVGSSCSCPIGWACKHAAAVLLAGNARHTAQGAAQTAEGWRRDLAALRGGSPALGAPRLAAKLLGLQFEARGRSGRASNRWAPVKETTALPGTPVERIAMRPVTRGARGGWIKGNLTWNNIGYQLHAGFDQASVRWFGTFALLHNARQSGYISYGADWLSLDDYESEMMWSLLADAQRLGIPLVGSGGAPRVRVAERASVDLDATATAEELVLTPTVSIGDEARSIETAGPIGDHGLYVVDFERGELVLGAVGSPLTSEQRSLLREPRRMRVPAAEVPEFLEGYYPTLARAVAVTSGDRSFEPPPVAPPQLVLTAAYEPETVLRLQWNDAELTTIDDLRAVLAEVAQVVGSLPADAVLTGVAAAEFTTTTLPRLRAMERVRVEVSGTAPDYRELLEPPKLSVTTVDSTDNDWFDLGVLVTVEGRTIPFGPLFSALSKGAGKLLLIDNTYLSLDQPVFAPLRALIQEAGGLHEWETGELRISRYQTDLWDEFAELADEVETAQSWTQTVAGLSQSVGVEPVPLPAGFTATLRPYQLEGYHWLAFLYAQRLGGILADDMGLGKTAQTLALISHAQEQGHGPFLVIAPTSLVSNWAAEAAKFTPGLRVATVTATAGKRGEALADIAARSDVVVATYAILRLDSEEFAGSQWAGLVLDEAQFAKNPQSRVNQAARGIHADFRLAVTGTPIENNLGELWALFRIVAPGLFPSARRFAEEYRRPIENEKNAERLARLRRRIRPLMLRRTKDRVASELPPKQEQVLSVELEPRHRRIYDMYLQRERQKLLGLVDDLDRNRFIVFRSLTLLRMLSLDAALIDEEQYGTVPSSKLDALFEQLDDVLAEGHRALVFSQFTSFLKRAAARFDAAGIPYAYLDGSTRNRGEVIERFRGGEAPVFLISLKAGGFGLNLTEADYVFLLDPWWNPASEAQAVDRAHRIGQAKNVMVYRMVASGTIEEKVMALKARKAELVNSVMDDDAIFSEALSADDIRGLLE